MHYLRRIAKSLESIDESLKEKSRPSTKELLRELLERIEDEEPYNIDELLKQNGVER